MGMYGMMKPISAAELRRLEAQNKLSAVLMQGDGTTDLDKAWHAIHFLLCGTVWGGEGLLADAVMGGEEVGEELGYGRPRFLSPEKTRAVSEALSALSPGEFAERFDAAALMEEEVYPGIWEDDPEELLEYVTSFYDVLRTCYAEAAANNQGMLLAVV